MPPPRRRWMRRRRSTHATSSASLTEPPAATPLGDLSAVRGAAAAAGLRLVALGGLGEIGRNLLAIECGEDIVVIDSGLMFPETEMLGVDLAMPAAGSPRG